MNKILIILVVVTLNSMWLTDLQRVPSPASRSLFRRPVRLPPHHMVSFQVEKQLIVLLAQLVADILSVTNVRECLRMTASCLEDPHDCNLLHQWDTMLFVSGETRKNLGKIPLPGVADESEFLTLNCQDYTPGSELPRLQSCPDLHIQEMEQASSDMACLGRHLNEAGWPAEFQDVQHVITLISKVAEQLQPPADR